MSESSIARDVSIWLLSGLLLSASASLLAQSSGSEQDQEDENAGLDRIIVIAQKREQNLQEVPVSIAVLSGERLNALTTGGQDVRLLSSRLPSLQIESSFGRAFPRFYVRGLGNTDFDLNASQPVSLVYDGVVQENPILKGFPMFDIERIENLRGPQGTTFGRNTPAGAVIFESRKPSQTPGGYAQIAYGEHNAVNFEGAYGGPINRQMSYRGAVLVQRRDDFVNNVFTGENDEYEGYEEVAGRFQLLYEAADFDALANFHFRSLDGTARLFRANIIEPGTNDLVDDFSFNNVAIDGTNNQDLDALGGSLTMNWDLGNAVVTSITGVESVDIISRGDIDGGFGASFAPPFGPGFIPFPAESADGLPEHIQVTQELRLSSNTSSRLQWQAGLYYFYEDLTIDSLNFNTLAGGIQDGFAQQEQETNAIAVFGSIDYELTDRLSMRAGLRVSNDDKDFKAQRTLSPFGAPPTPVLRASPDDTEYSWDLSLTYAATEDVNVYTRLARGFRAPSVQGRLLFGDEISVADTETLFSAEAGFKSMLFDERLRANASVYAYKIDDQQLTAVGGQANFNRLINADSTAGRGFELDMEAFVSDALTLTAGMSHNYTKINDSTLSIQPCGGGCTVLDPPGSVPGTVSIDGNRLPQAPRWVANATARYAIPFKGGELFAFTDWAYRTEINFFLYESVEFTGESLLEGGLRLGYNWDLGNQEFVLFGRNITDQVRIVGGIDFNNLTGFVNEPRTWGAQYIRRF
ncbi:MAG: TonB-dependent receptor [Xanthomonadales bacterium]|nr:TonB-dependent receptor [Xanthomonadales bacterium]|tara:strand:- start:438 stop:2687 length:2250 start_codon:yes stop_codon:yes gene_type:complete